MQLLKFEKNDCQPCKQVSDYLALRAYTAIDAYEQPDTARKFKVRTVPTLILLDDYDVEIGRTIGFKPSEIDALLLKGELILPLIIKHLPPN